MGLSMRYPRFFIVLFLALALAGLPAVGAHASDTDLLSDALRQIDVMADVSQQAAAGADLAHRDGTVELLAQRVDVNHNEADLLLDAVTALVVAVTRAGERAGVLKSPEIEVLLDVLVEIVRSSDPQADRTFANADFFRERAIEAAELQAEFEFAAMDALASRETVSTADPVEQWRPLVERYFAPERVEEALSIIDCESNGDPTARNPRSSAAGLFQFLDRTWLHSSEQAGFQGESPLSPEANIAAAAWLVEYSIGVGDSPWAHWTCRP
jgi:hypothetical protein